MSLEEHVKKKIIDAIKKSMKGTGPKGLTLSEITALCGDCEGFLYYHIRKLLSTHPDMVGVGNTRNRRYIYCKNANDPGEYKHSRQFHLTDEVWNRLKRVVDTGVFATRSEFVLFAIENALEEYEPEG